MAKPYTSLSVAATVLITVAACVDDINAPGVCPAFCPDAEIIVLDTLLTGVVERDSSYFGYVDARDGSSMQVTNAGAAVESRGVLRFSRFPNDVLGPDGSTRLPIVQTDSFHFVLPLEARNETVSGLEVVLYRIPYDVDSTTTFADLDPFFADSMEIGVAAIADTVNPDSVVVTVLYSALTDFERDTLKAAVGVSVRGAADTYVTLETLDGGVGARMTRFVQTDTSGTGARDSRLVDFDTFLRRDRAAMPGNSLVAGLSPSARAILRFDLPDAIIDSATVVGAILYLVPVSAALGAPGDTFSLQANGLAADFGAKSPLLLIIASDASDSTFVPAANVPVGTTDTVKIDVTPLLRNWQSTPGRPHTMVIRVSPEGGTLGTLYFGASSHPLSAPAIRMTYINPFRFEGAR